jgi:TP901 family phage tail tape measure protein
MAKAFVINAQVKTTFAGAEKGLEKIKTNLNNIVNSMQNVPENTKKSVIELASSLEKLSDRATTGISSGSFGNPAEIQRYLQDLRKAEIEQMKITDQLITQNNFTEDQTKEINKQTQAIQKKTRALEQTERDLEAIRVKTQKVTEAEVKAAGALGIAPETLKATGGVEAEIAKRKDASGQPISKEAKKEIKILEEVLRIRQEIDKISPGALETEKKLLAKQQEQGKELNGLKNKREALIKKGLDELLVAGKITKKEYDKNMALLEQGKSYKAIEESVRKANLKQLNKETVRNVKAAQKQAKAQEQVKKGFLQNVTAATLYYSALRIVRRVISTVTKTVTQLDDSFTQIAMVTSLTRKEAWALTSQYQDMALTIGTTTEQVAKLGVFFARQGRSASEAMELTRVAALAAKVASIDATESANFLTSAINGFGLAIDQAMDVSDKFAALGASSASSYQEMAVALSKVAPSAKVAGVNIDQMLGFLAKGIETTREAPENIGTAFKTVFARMTQLRDFGKTLEEGVAVNTVEEALRTAGVALRDNQGNFRQMGDVLTELGYKFEGLSRNQQAYIATALAGTRQQSRLLAVLQNFDRTMELVQTSTEAAGATLAQHTEFSGGMEAANARLQTSFQQIITNLISSDAVIAVVNLMAKAIQNLSKFVVVLTIVMGLLTAGLIIYNLAKKSSILLEGMSVKKTVLATFAYQVYQVVLGKAKVATLGFGKALAVTTGGITIILAVIGMLVVGLLDTIKAAEKTSEKVKQLQVDLFNLSKEEQDFNKLVDRFKELERQTFKTSEELNEMATLLEKIKEAGGSEYDFVLAGTLDDEVIERYMEVLEERRAMKVEELRETGKDLITPDVKKGELILTDANDLDAGGKDAVVEYIASLFDDFDNMQVAQQEQIRTNIRNNLQEYIDNLQYQQGMYAGGSINEQASAMSLSKELNDVMNDNFETIFTGLENGSQADSGRLSEIFANFLNLDPEDQEFLKNIYSSQLGNIFALDEQVIEDLISKGFNINSINALLANIENSLGEFEGSGQITEFYAGLLSGIDPNDPDALREIQSRTIAEISRIAPSYEAAQTAIKNFVGAVTDPMAFGNAMNIFKETTNSLKTLLDASEAFAKGEIPENFEQLIRDYPALAEDIRNGTLDMEKAMEYVTDSAVEDVKQKISDLRRQMAQEDDPAVVALFEAQIATLEEMLSDPTFFFGKFIEQATKEMEDMYKAQIDYVQNLNKEKKDEIDLMEQKLSMTKSMLDLDRQLAALSRDTSYGAQARTRDLQEQQRAAAIEREKFVMDLITEQAISDLEKKRDENVQSIKDNVAVIAGAFKTSGAGVHTKGALSTINARTGISLVSN